MHRDDLRRSQRVRVCCRVDVRDRLGVWTAVTEDFCSRGCGLVTPKSPRVGSSLDLTLWSDLFPEPLEIVATTAWASDQRVGVIFVTGTSPPGKISPAEWARRLVEHGRVLGPEPIGSDFPRVVPVVLRRSAPTSRVLEHGDAATDGRPRPDGEADILMLPAGHH